LEVRRRKEEQLRLKMAKIALDGRVRVRSLIETHFPLRVSLRRATLEIILLNTRWHTRVHRHGVYQTIILAHNRAREHRAQGKLLCHTQPTTHKKFYHKAVCNGIQQQRHRRYFAAAFAN
jgi:hypothetical protein